MICNHGVSVSHNSSKSICHYHPVIDVNFSSGEYVRLEKGGMVVAFLSESGHLAGHSSRWIDMASQCSYGSVVGGLFNLL